MRRKPAGLNNPARGTVECLCLTGRTIRGAATFGHGLTNVYGRQKSRIVVTYARVGDRCEFSGRRLIGLSLHETTFGDGHSGVLLRSLAERSRQTDGRNP